MSISGYLKLILTIQVLFQEHHKPSMLRIRIKDGEPHPFFPDRILPSPDKADFGLGGMMQRQTYATRMLDLIRRCSPAPRDVRKKSTRSTYENPDTSPVHNLMELFCLPDTSRQASTNPCGPEAKNGSSVLSQTITLSALRIR